MNWLHPIGFCFATLLFASHSFAMDNTTQLPVNLTSVFSRYPTWADLAQKIAPVNLFVDRYVTIFFYIVGFPGNLISFIVWTSRRVYKGNSAAIYLAAVSLNDIFVLVFALIRDLSRCWYVTIYNTAGACEVKNTLQTTVQYASPLFVLGFTVERWLAIYRPFAVERISSPRRAIYICIGIIVVTIIICSGNAVIFVADERGECAMRFEDSKGDDLYLAILELIFSFAVPLLVLAFNCLVIRELARIHRADKQLASASIRLSTVTPSGKSDTADKFKFGKPLAKSTWRVKKSIKHPDGDGVAFAPRDSNRQSCKVIDSNGYQTSLTEHEGKRPGHGTPSFRSTTLMLLIVSFYMIITTLLGGILYVVHHIQKQPNPYFSDEEIATDPDWITYTRVMTVKAFADEFALSYYALGFIIYYCTGQNFRTRVHQLLRRLLNSCGFRCKALSRMGVSEELDFTSAARRTQRVREPLTTHTMVADVGGPRGRRHSSSEHKCFTAPHTHASEPTQAAGQPLLNAACNRFPGERSDLTTHTASPVVTHDPLLQPQTIHNEL